MCRDRKIVVVEDRRPHCWLCGTAGHLPKMSPGRKPVPHPAKSKEVAAKSKSAEVTDSPGEWREVVKKESNVVAPSPSPQKDVPNKKERTLKQSEEGKNQ